MGAKEENKDEVGKRREETTSEAFRSDSRVKRTGMVPWENRHSSIVLLTPGSSTVASPIGFKCRGQLIKPCLV